MDFGISGFQPSVNSTSSYGSSKGVTGYQGYSEVNPFSAKISSNDNGFKSTTGYQGFLGQDTFDAMEALLNRQKVASVGKAAPSTKATFNSGIDTSIWSQNGGAPVNHGDGFYGGTIGSGLDFTA